MRGGRAFTKPLPFGLGGNVNGLLASDPNNITALQACSMTSCRVQIGWNNTFGNTPGFELTVGGYNSSAAATIASYVATMKAAGITPLIIVTTYVYPSLCPTLTSALASGTMYTSIAITENPYAINVGDTITLTTGPNGSTQTVIANANVPAGTAAGSLAVQSFTAAHNFGIGSWVYDAAWPPCTPAHLAAAMAWLVAQSGLQGLHWEILNEPDGYPYGGGGFPSSGVAPLLYTQMMGLTYPAMKAADPTCIVHGFCLESLSPLGYEYIDGTQYYVNCVATGILTNNGSGGKSYDIVSVHLYTNAANGSPDYPDPYYYGTMAQLLANFRAVMLSYGDTTPIWITESGWSVGGSLTALLQGQFIQDLLVRLSGMDWVNNVLFSSYLTCWMVYSLTGVSYSWSLFPNGNTGTPNPAVAILAEMVAGN